MVEIVYYVATSVDGYIATPDGGIEWLTSFESGGEDYGYAEFYASVEAVLLGRRTFEQVLSLGEWPYTGKSSWVFSQQPHPSPPPQVTLTSQSPAEVVTALADQGIRRAWLVGGGQLAGSFQAAGLISEHIISIIPIILGEGIPLFGEAGAMERLQMMGNTPYDNGLVQIRYRGLMAA
jgi:dihydrofolate reductase